MKSSFPNSSQFSPVQTPLPELLLLAKQNQPSRQRIKEAIRLTFFPDSPDPDISENTIYALSEYRILDKPLLDQTHSALTQFGEELAAKAESNQLNEMYEQLATHILLNLRGMELIHAIDDLASRGTSLTKATISRELSRRNFHIPKNGTHLNGMRQWLEQAKLVEPGKWQANPNMLKKLLGEIDSTEIDEYAQLTQEQRAFALAFARMDQDEALSNRVAEYATSLYGVEFPEGGLPQSTLFALQNVGLITCHKTTSGQGAKPYIVRRTKKLKSKFLEPIFQSIEENVGRQYRKLVRMPLSEILVQVDSEDKHIKGKALEALAFYLSRLIDLQFVKWRLRTRETGGAELDVIMEGANLLFSRWQIQCKNSAQATLEDIAKELGIAQLIKTNVIMVVTTGKIGRAAKSFADKVMRDTNHQVVLLSSQDLTAIKADPTAITDILKSQSKAAMTLKRTQLEII